MKNLIQGWATTIIGLTLMVLSILHFYGFVSLPAPEGITPEWQLTAGFTVGLILFLIPKGKIEQFLSNFLNKKSNE